MNNPLFQMLGGQNSGLIERFNQFRQTFKGDPKQTIQQMLNSGKVTQQQYDNAVRTAQQLMRILGGK